MTKTLNKKLIFIFLFAFIAILGFAGGLFFYVMAKKPIEDIPQSLSVQKIDDQYVLVAEHKNNFEYQFKLEQYIDGDFLLIKNVDSKLNTIKLEDNDLSILPGGKYRFSVCYTKESILGKYSDFVEWQPSTALKTIDYTKVVFEDDALSWNAVEYAQKYWVALVDKDGNQQLLKTTDTTICLDDVSVGKYKVFISAQSDDIFYLSSSVGEGKDIVLTRQNEIVSASLSSDGLLSISTTQEVKQFEIYQNDDLLLSFETPQNVSLNFVIDLSFALKNVDKSNLKIKSLATQHILESDLVQIV